MRRLALLAAAIAVVLYVPVPLVAQPGGGTKALVPVSEIPPKVEVPVGTGVAEAPTAGAPEQAPNLVPTQEIEQEAASRAGAVTAPAPESTTAEPQAVPALQPNAELAQEVTVPEPPPEETPNQETPPDGQDEDDPEEFEEDFDDVPPEEDQEGTPRIAPRQRAAPAGDRLPQTGRELLVLGLIGSGLMLFGTGLRGIAQPRLQRI